CRAAGAVRPARGSANWPHRPGAQPAEGPGGPLMHAPSATYSTRPIRPELRQVLDSLQPGQRIRITQTVRVGLQSWPAIVVGLFRHVDSLATGLATDRVPTDDIIVPIVHFTKDNGELSSVALDENSVIERVDA